jgi:hypothetical protein
MFGSTLSIDLGASFTKVAWRKACRPRFGQAARETAKVLAVDGSALIPSVAIRTGRAEQPWVFGQNAAVLRPGPKMEVFRNWKADLFQSDNNPNSAAAAVVAQNFFGWLYEEIGQSELDLTGARVTVAMPAFTQSDRNAAVVLRCMSLAGWQSFSAERVTEPHANLLGLMSGGTSHVQANRAGEPFLNYGRMFGQSSHFVQAARNYGLHSRGPSRLGVLVVDIGAFTTDFAHLVFDFSDEDHLGDGLTSLRQTSVTHGVINQLDKPVMDELTRHHAVDWNQASSVEIELLKGALYAGRGHQYVTRDGRSISLGESADRQLVDGLIEAFASLAWGHARKFIGSASVQLAFLTGGGSQVPKIREKLAADLMSEGIRTVNLPIRSPSPTQARCREWSKDDGGLERLATALGGTSVVLEVTSEPNTADSLRVAARPPMAPRITEPVSCRCGGLNPDCSFCEGRGYT